jgi:hypothetical protein
MYYNEFKENIFAKEKGGAMRKLILLTVVLSLVYISLGCGRRPKTVISIGEIKISAEEFNSAFNKSLYGNSPTLERRRQFLSTFINRKIILKEAVKGGLDKDPGFLEDVQFFWEQALIKLTLNKKIKELASGIQISEKEIKDYYETRKSEFPGKNLAEVGEQIKLQLFIEKQRRALDDWLVSLAKKSRIGMDYKSLGLE